MEEVDILIKTIKELHQNTVFIERDYVYDQKKINLDGYYVNTDDFFEKLKHILEDRIKPKLEWEQNSSSNLMNWYEANEYAKSLGVGWGLPTIEELKEAYDNKVEGFQSGYYWSSSTYAYNTNNAWYFGFYYGDVYDGIKTYNYHVRCVREIK